MVQGLLTNSPFHVMPAEILKLKTQAVSDQPVVGTQKVQGLLSIPCNAC